MWGLVQGVGAHLSPPYPTASLAKGEKNRGNRSDNSFTKTVKKSDAQVSSIDNGHTHLALFFVPFRGREGV